MFKESKLKNSFRILKDGKISLVTTALLLGVSTCNLSAVTVDYDDLSGSNVTINSSDVPTPGDDIRLIHTINQTFTIASDVNIDSSASGIRLDFTTDTTIINNGTIQGSDYGVNSFFDHGTSFTNNGIITSENGYAFRFEDTSFVNGDDGVVNGSIRNWMGSVTNNGLINLSNNINNNGVNTFTNGSTGTLRVNLQTDGTTTTYSTLETSTAIFENGSTIDVNVSNSSTNVGLLAGSTLTDVITSNSLTIDGTLNITDNSALVNFEYERNGNNLDLNVVKASTIVDETRTGLGNTNALIIADKLDFINDNIINFSGMENIIMVLNEKTSSIDIKNAVDSLLPQISQSNLITTNRSLVQTSLIIFNRMSNRISNNTSINSGDEVVVKDKTLWIKPFGSIGSQANKDGMNGFDVKSYGIGMGFDGKDKNDQMVGVGLFLSNASVDMNNVNQESDTQAYTLSMYGAIPVIDNKTNFLYQLSYGLQNTDSSREVFTGDIATADYTSKMASIDARLVRDYQINKDLLVQPLVFATYKNFKSPSYGETGAAGANLNVEKSSSNEMVLGLGTMASYNLNASDKLTGSLSVGYDVRDDENKTVSSFQGASGVNFESVGIDNGRWSYDAGVGYEKSIDNKNSVSVNYNFQGEGSDYTNNVVSANYIYKF
jgi:outer membrane autotransporter protein